MTNVSNIVVAATIDTMAQGSILIVKVSDTVPTMVLVYHGEKPEKFNRLNFKK